MTIPVEHHKLKQIATNRFVKHTYVIVALVCCVGLLTLIAPNARGCRPPRVRISLNTKLSNTSFSNGNTYREPILELFPQHIGRICSTAVDIIPTIPAEGQIMFDYW